MRFNVVALLLIAGVMSWTPHEADARAVKGDKTLGLGMNYISWSKYSHQICDGEGNNCTTTYNTTTLNIGEGLSGGYLITDLLEIGIGIGTSQYSSETKPVPATPDNNSKYSRLDLSGIGYVELHLGSNATLVPFVGGGLGLGIDWQTDNFSNVETHSGFRTFELFANGGIDYYIGDKYAIECSLGITHSGEAFDSDTRIKTDGIDKSGSWTIGFGLGISTYF
jgi:hypothetical protein